MSGSINQGAPSGGVVRNSALSFVAHAQPAAESESSLQDHGEMGHNGQTGSDRLVPPGLKALCEAYSRLYPDQPNPLQATTRLKYWLGGHDPLDYISMYWNPGKPEENIPPHWHYVSFGLSDLHGDGRVHPAPAGGGAPSGFGAELSLRLEAPAPPPLWPAALLQALARYVFTTGNKLCAGDHITWHAPLDGGGGRVRHLLVAADPQLPAIDTPHGAVCFLQMVGCTSRELRAAQRTSGFHVLKLIAEDPKCGGAWLVTRTGRGSARGAGGGGRGASDLAGVSAACRWEPYAPSAEERDTGTARERADDGGGGAGQGAGHLSPRLQRQIKETLQRGLSCMDDRSGPEGHTGMSTDSFEMSSIERALPHVPELMQGSWRGEEEVVPLEAVHLYFNPEGASVLPLAIDGRVRHGRHFTFRCGARALTLLSPRVAGAFATPHQPYMVKGCWLQILIPNDLAEDMSKQLAPLSRLARTDSSSESEGEAAPPPAPPLAYRWPAHRLRITVLPDHELL